jgi:hypothetical protein
VIDHYNSQRPHQALDGATPAERFSPAAATASSAARIGAASPAGPQPAGTEPPARPAARAGEAWVSRRVAVNGVISVSWQQICVGASHAGANVDVEVSPELLRVWRGDELIKTVTRSSRGEVRKKNASARTARD